MAIFKFNKILTKRFLIKEYIKEKKSMKQVAEKVGCTIPLISLYMIKYYIPRRSSSQIALKLWENKEYRKSQTKAHLGYKMPDQQKKKIGIKSKKNWEDKEYRTKSIRFGKEAPNYIHGQGRFPYPLEFKYIKESIRIRDNHQCQICGIKEEDSWRKLDIHHIDYDKENLNPENLISLCNRCHMQTNGNRGVFQEYFGILMSVIK